MASTQPNMPAISYSLWWSAATLELRTRNLDSHNPLTLADRVARRMSTWTNARRLASQGISPFLDLEDPVRPDGSACCFLRGLRSDPQDEPRNWLWGRPPISTGNC